MERCDFSSIITTVRKYIGDDRGMNQIDLLYAEKTKDSRLA